MTENKAHPAASKLEKKGGYPAGNKPIADIKPPPPSVSQPRPTTRAKTK